MPQWPGHFSARYFLLVLLIGLVMSHSKVLAQQLAPVPCTATAPPSAAQRSHEQAQNRPASARASNEAPSLAAPVLLIIAGPIVGVGALAVGANSRSFCTDGCDNDIPTPFLVTAALAGAAAIVGTVWLVARLVARSAQSRELERRQTERRRLGFSLELSPGLASAGLRVAF